MKITLSSLLIILVYLTYSCKKDEQSTAPRDFQISQEVIEGITYKCITLGDQVWMAENLKTRLHGGRGDGCMTFEEGLVLEAPKDKVSAALIKSLESGVFNSSPMFQAYSDYIIRSLIIPDFFKPGGRNYAFKWDRYSALFKADPWNSYELPYFVVIEVEVLKLYEEEKKKAILAAADTNYVKEHGYLYTFAASKKVIPAGWRMPTDEDWMKLERAMGMKEEDIQQVDTWRGNIGGSLKADATRGNFNAKLSGGYIYGKSNHSDNFINKGIRAYWWSSTKHVEADTASTYFTRALRFDNDQMLRGTARTESAYSIRLVRDK